MGRQGKHFTLKLNHILYSRLFSSLRRITTMPGCSLEWQPQSCSSWIRHRSPTERLLNWSQSNCWHGR